MPPLLEKAIRFCSTSCPTVRWRPIRRFGKRENLALFSVSALKEGGVIIKFDGPTMLNDEIVDSEFRERQLIVESTTETTINCIGASSASQSC